MSGAKVPLPEGDNDFTWEWAPVLDGEVIVDSTVTAPEGLAIESMRISGTKVIARISGGTAGQSYKVLCGVTTNGPLGAGSREAHLRIEKPGQLNPASQIECVRWRRRAGKWLAIVRRLVATAAIGGLLVLGARIATSPAPAHSFYPVVCCSDKDCRPLEPHEVRETPDGWIIVATGELVRTEAARRDAPDGRMHVCQRPSGKVIYVGSRACLWAPEAGL